MEENKKMFYKPNQTIMVTNKEITTTQRKAYNVILFDAQKELYEDNNKTSFLFNIAELKKRAGIKATDNWHIKQDLEELSDIKISTVKENGDWGFFRLISEARKEGDLLKVEIPNTIRKALIEKTFYTTLDLLILKNLTSKYAVIIYEIAMRYNKVEIPKFTIQEFRMLTGTAEIKSYDNFAMLKKKVIEPAIKEINEKTDIFLTYETEEKGRKTISIKFKIVSKNQNIDAPKNEKEEQINYIIETFKSKTGGFLNSVVVKNYIESKGFQYVKNYCDNWENYCSDKTEKEDVCGYFVASIRDGYSEKKRTSFSNKHIQNDQIDFEKFYNNF